MNITKLLHFALGPVVTTFLGFLSLIAITHLFTPADVGRISMLQIICSFSVLLFSLGLDQAYVREYHEESDKGSLLKTTLLPGFVVLFSVVLLLIPFSSQITLMVFDLDSQFIFALTALVVLVNFIARYFSLTLRMQERGLAYSMVMILPKLLFLLFIAAYWLVGTQRDFTHLASAHFVSTLAIVLVLVFYIRGDLLRASVSEVNYSKLKSMMTYGLPLIIGGVAYWGLISVDRVGLRSMTTYSEVGLYSVATSIAAATSIIESVFSSIWSPMVYKWVAAGENLEKIDRVNEYMLAIVVSILTFCGLFSWLVNYILPVDYADVKYIITSCIAMPLLYTLSETTVVGIGVSRKTSYAMAAAIIALITNLLLIFLLIPHYGARGAAVSTAIAFYVFLIIRTESSVYLWRSFARSKMYSMVGLALGISILFTLFGDSYGQIIYCMWIGYLFIAMVAFKDLLRKVYILVSFNGKRFFITSALKE